MVALCLRIFALAASSVFYSQAFSLPDVSSLRPRFPDTLRLRGGVSSQDVDAAPLFEHVVLGGGNAAGYFLKHTESSSGVCVISDEDCLPYERPALTKGYLLGKLKSPQEGGFICNDMEIYKSKNITFLQQRRALQVDFNKRCVMVRHMNSKEHELVRFRKLVIAMGCSPRKFHVTGSHLDNIVYVKNVHDIDRIRSHAMPGKNVVVVGGGYIGMEVSACLAILGSKVTWMVREDRLLPRRFSPEMSKFFEELWEQKGVSLMKDSKVVDVRGERSVESVIDNHGNNIDCDLVVVGIGSQPNTEIFEGTGLQLDPTSKHIVVDSKLQTNLENVFAVGDIIKFPQRQGDDLTVQEHVTHARSSGKFLATKISDPDDNTLYSYSPLFYSRVDPWNLSWQMRGAAVGKQTIIGTVARGNFSVLWTEEGRIRGGFHCRYGQDEDERDAFEVLTRLVEENLTREQVERVIACRSIFEADDALKHV